MSKDIESIQHGSLPEESYYVDKTKGHEVRLSNDGIIPIKDLFWYSYPEISPTKSAPLEVLTSYGIRQVVADYSRGIGGFSFTDCTHPMQNMNCNMYAMDGWRYQDLALNIADNIKVNPTTRVSFGDDKPYTFTLSKLPWYIRLWQFLHPKAADS